MNDVLRVIRDLLCYCGVSKSDYNSVKKEAYISNFTIWKYLHLLLTVVYAVSFSFTMLSGSFDISALIGISLTAYFAAASVLFLAVFKEDSLVAQFLIYLSMILLLLSSLMNDVQTPGMTSVTFVVLLVMLPMFMIDKPYFMAILIAAAAGIYLWAIYGIKPREVFSLDLVNIIAYGAFGIIINVFYNYIRIQEFLLRRRERDYIAEQTKSADESRRLNHALKRMSESVIEVIGDVVESRDLESGEHIQRVKGFTYILANQIMQDLPEYNLDSYTVDLIAFTSALHDVGKLSIPDAILCKPSRLSPEEFEVMKTHCEKGCDIIRKMSASWSHDYISMGIDICMSHHEKWDGSGYPRGLKGDEIPIAAQIVSIADIYDALTSKRVYKGAYSHEKAYRMIMDGECGAFSEKLLTCFTKCRDKFEAHAANGGDISFVDHDYELISRGNPEDSFVIGLHDQDRTLREKLRIEEEFSVLKKLSVRYSYICYVLMNTNEVIRFRADEQFARIADSFGDELKSYEKFDKLLNSIIVAEDYEKFRRDTERKTAVATLREKGSLTTDFRIRLDDGVHYCRMRLTVDDNNPDAVIIGISKRDEAHKLEEDYLNARKKLELARQEAELREQLADKLAVIDCISDEYDYVCALNAETMQVTVYRTAEWIRDMLKNLEDIVVSPEARKTTMKGIIYPPDFEDFLKATQHETVMQALKENGSYSVNYRAYKYGKLVNHQTRYTLDKNDPTRIIIGLRTMS